MTFSFVFDSLCFQIARRDRTIKHLELENSDMKRISEEKKEENGKLQTRLQVAARR